jgi:glycosyltransferase involved in cell wall biosynthesis
MAEKVLYIISRVSKSKDLEVLARHWDQERYRMEVVLVNGVPDCDVQQDFLAASIPCTTLLYRGPRDIPRTIAALVRHIRASRPYIVHTHLQEASLMGLVAARIAGVQRRVHTRHQATVNHREHPVKGVLYDRICNALAEHIVAISGPCRDVLVQREGVAPEKVTLIHHGFDLDQRPPYAPDRNTARLCDRYGIGREGHGPVVALIARPIAIKGLDHAIAAFAELLGTHPRAQCVIFNWCHTTQIDHYQRLLDRLPAGSWRTVAPMPEIWSMYPAFDVFLHVPIDRDAEAFGLVYIEALLSGTPSVFTRSGVMADVEPERLSGVRMVPFEDSTAIVKAIRGTLDGTDGTEMRRTHADANARVLVEQLDIRNTLQALYALYDAR